MEFDWFPMLFFSRMFYLCGRSKIGEELEFHIAKGHFFKDHNLPPNRYISYSEYMRQAMTHHITESIEVKPKSWVALILLLFLNLLRNLLSTDPTSNGKSSYNASSELFFYFMLGWLIFIVDFVPHLPCPRFC